MANPLPQRCKPEPKRYCGAEDRLTGRAGRLEIFRFALSRNPLPGETRGDYGGCSVREPTSAVDRRSIVGGLPDARVHHGKIKAEPLPPATSVTAPCNQDRLSPSSRRRLSLPTLSRAFAGALRNDPSTSFPPATCGRGHSDARNGRTPAASRQRQDRAARADGRCLHLDLAGWRHGGTGHL